jgi:predicted ATP-dependent endonuclease of OLD family
VRDVKIEKVSIDKLGCLTDIDIKFGTFKSDKEHELNISVIVGENGTGKTTLMKFLSAIFHENAKKKNNLKYRYKVDYKIDGKDYEISTNTYSKVMPRKIIVSTYSPFEQYNHTGPKSSGDIKIEYKYVGPRSESIWGSIQKSPTTILLPLMKVLYSKNEKKKKSILKLLHEIGYESPSIELSSKEMRLNKQRTRSVGKKTSGIISNLNEFHLQHQDEENPRVYSTETLEEYEGGASKWLEDINALKNIKQNIIKSIWFERNGEPINILDMSSGELSLLFRFVNILEEVEDNSVVIIDEPEIHLHPRWLMKYFNLIYSVFKDYKAHFIFATHSPLIASDVPQECIIGLKYDDDLKRIRQFNVEGNTLGTNTEDILKDVFLIEKEVGDFTLYIIKKIKEQIQKGEINDALNLYHMLGESDEKFQLYKEIKLQSQKE